MNSYRDGFAKELGSLATQEITLHGTPALHRLERVLQYTATQEIRDRRGWSFRVMDVEKVAMYAGIGFAIALGLFVLYGPTPDPRKKKGKVSGINNLGYTCFLNALLQAMAACTTFTLWLDEQQRKREGSLSNTLFTVLNKINGLDCDFYNNVTPSKLNSSLKELWDFGPGQQDAHELFHIILNALEAEIQPANRNGCLSDALRSASCDDIVLARLDSNKPGMIIARSSECLPKNGENEDSSWQSWSSMFTILHSNGPSVSVEMHPFLGLITNQLQCSDCKWKVPTRKSSVRYDKFETLSLSLPSSSFYEYHTLEQLLSHFVASETVPDVQCDRCSSRCSAIKTLSLGKLPKCLCLHIPRTVWSSSGVLTKRDDRVQFPQFLVLDPYTYTETMKRNAQGDGAGFFNISGMTEGKHKYRLCAVIEHSGPVDSGHFICFRRGNKAGQWLYTSDAIVENVALTQVLLANPYMLFYESVKDSQELS